MLDGIVALIAGLLLFFGKRLFWLAAGLVAFLFGYQLFGNLFDQFPITIFYNIISHGLFEKFSITPFN